MVRVLSRILPYFAINLVEGEPFDKDQQEVSGKIPVIT